MGKHFLSHYNGRRKAGDENEARKPQHDDTGPTREVEEGQYQGECDSHGNQDEVLMPPSIRQGPTQERADGPANQKDEDQFSRIDGFPSEVVYIVERNKGH